MTRFELAATLSRGLNQLEESRKHREINKCIHNVNTQIENGIPENEAVESLGNTDKLIEDILAQYNIADRPQDESVEIYEQSEVAESTEKSGFAQRFDEIKNNRFVQNTAEKVKAVADNAGEKTKEKIADTAPKVKNGVFNFGRAVKSGAEYITFTLMNTIIFLLIWMPCMFITAVGIVTTVALCCFYLFTGIGFAGICIAGAGCCVVGVSFCLWLTACLTRGKKHE